MRLFVVFSVLLGLSFSASSGFASAETYRYLCSAEGLGLPSRLSEAGYAVLTISGKQLRFQHYDDAYGEPYLLQEFLYEAHGPADQAGPELRDMIVFKMTKRVRSRGASIHELLVDQVLLEGGTPLDRRARGGRIGLPGPQVEWLSCKRQ